MFWILKTGAPWRGLPPDYVDCKNTHRSFCRWRDKDNGMPVRMFITSGAVADCAQGSKLIEGLTAEHLLAGKGYDSKVLIDGATEQGMTVVILPKKNRTKQKAIVGTGGLRKIR